MDKIEVKKLLHDSACKEKYKYIYIDLYLYIKNVQDMKNGFYIYDLYEHSFKVIKIIDVDLEVLIRVEENIKEKISMLIIWVYKNYGEDPDHFSLGKSMAYMEIGSACQKLFNLSKEMDIGICEIGSFNERVIEDYIGIDGVNKKNIGVVLFGDSF